MYLTKVLPMNTIFLLQILLTKYQMLRLAIFGHLNQLQAIHLNNKVQQQTQHMFHQCLNAQQFSSDLLRLVHHF